MYALENVSQNVRKKNIDFGTFHFFVIALKPCLVQFGNIFYWFIYFYAAKKYSGQIVELCGLNDRHFTMGNATLKTELMGYDLNKKNSPPLFFVFPSRSATSIKVKLNECKISSLFFPVISLPPPPLLPYAAFRILVRLLRDYLVSDVDV